MSLGIFSFDLEALINSLSAYFMDVSEPETNFPTDNTTAATSLDRAEDVLQSTTVADSKLDDILMATALSNTVTSVILSDTSKKEKVAPAATASTSSTPTTPVRTPSSTLSDSARREIEELIRLLQTSVIYNYRSEDIINEDVSLKMVTNFPNREIPKDIENKADSIREDRKREDLKLENLREELKRAMLKNNSDV